MYFYRKDPKRTRWRHPAYLPGEQRGWHHSGDSYQESCCWFTSQTRYNLRCIIFNQLKIERMILLSTFVERFQRNSIKDVQLMWASLEVSTNNDIFFCVFRCCNRSRVAKTKAYKERDGGDNCRGSWEAEGSLQGISLRY